MAECITPEDALELISEVFFELLRRTTCGERNIKYASPGRPVPVEERDLPMTGIGAFGDVEDRVVQVQRKQETFDDLLQVVLADDAHRCESSALGYHEWR